MSSISSLPAAWTVIIPVKQTTIAKTRLAAFGPALRQQLALAFACDTICAVRACPRIERVVVVTNDASVDLFRALGADVMPDTPDAGLNPALLHAGRLIRRDRPGAPLAAVAADLPALRPEALSIVLASTAPAAFFVPDAAGDGTTLVAAAARAQWQPSFGRNSRSLHRMRGLAEVDSDGLETLRRDVDTEADLWDAQRLGVGGHTRHVLSALAAGEIA